MRSATFGTGLWLFAALLLASTAPVSLAATITIINQDGGGEGFNDPTPASPVGGNPGTTIGQQRLNVFQRAADIWGGSLVSSVLIRVQAQFNVLSCDAMSAVLGSAGPITVHRGFSGAGFANTWYHQALANKQAGVDVAAGTNDINAQFNSALNGDPGCLGGTGWYYGFDGNEGNDIELLPVVLHEMGHGLGFSTLVNLSTGAELDPDGGGPGLPGPDLYERFIRDNSSGLLWTSMSNAQRQASAINTGNLVWDGAQTTAEAPTVLYKRTVLVVNSPGGIAGSKATSPAEFGAHNFGAVTANVVVANDGSGTTSDGCQSFINGPAVAGKVALVDRGTCNFTVKAANAQAAGAVGVLIANNVAGLTPQMAGIDPDITIPVEGISQADGAAVKANLPVNVTMSTHATLLTGADNTGKVLLYAPDPLEPGSSISHWDATALPNLLMEPAINDVLSSEIDLTAPHFEDIGWGMVTPTVLAFFTAEGREDGVLLRWQFTTEEPRTVEVLRAPTSEGPWSWIPVEIESQGPVTTALDRDVEPGRLFHYRLEVSDDTGTHSLGWVSARRAGAVNLRASLSVPRPNPTNGEATVTFRIEKPEYVELLVVDVAGRSVGTLQAGMLGAGEYSRTWNGLDARSQPIAPGLYLFKLRTSKGIQTRRGILVR